MQSVLLYIKSNIALSQKLVYCTVSLCNTSGGTWAGFLLAMLVYITLLKRMVICAILAVEIAVKDKGNFFPTTQHLIYKWKGDKNDPRQGSTSEHSSVQLSS